MTDHACTVFFLPGLGFGSLSAAPLAAALSDRFRVVGINGECLPAENNRIVLADEVDEWGIPRAVVTFTTGPNEQSISEHATATMTRILEAAGALETRVLARTAHTLGTCRMSADPGTGVVDADGRSHDIPNLWISDNSTFPSALTANPGLAQMALSLRTADRMMD